MNRFTRTGAAIAATAAVTSLAACGGGDGGGSAASQSAEDAVTIGLDADAAPNGYDPLLYSQGQYFFFSSLYDALFVTGPDGTVEPNLVESSEPNADNTQLTLTLKDGVTFTDGSTLSADLVKANLDRRSDTDLAAYGQLAPGGASEITKVDVKDDTTVVITWKAPQATGQNALADEAGVIVGQDGVDDPDSLKTTPAGSGPYTLDEGATNRPSNYALVKNDKAWNADAFAYDKISFKVITDAQALGNAVVSGQADVAFQLRGNAIQLVDDKQSIVKVGGTIIGFPVADKTGTTNEAFSKVEVRQALGHAIDRESIVTDLKPGARPTSQLFPESAPGFDPAIDEEFAYDPEKAKQLLADAGYPNGFDIDMTVGGQPDDIQVAVQNQWKQIGVNLNFVTATSTDQVFAAAQTEPLLYGPFALGDQPQGFVAGVVVNGFMNLQHAKDADIEGALGQALGASGDAHAQALTTLNRAITEKGWYIPVLEDFTYAGYSADKVAEPSFAGTNGYLVLSSVAPVA
jgi:peptide/nickel transport system substrate-binding protein